MSMLQTTLTLLTQVTVSSMLAVVASVHKRKGSRYWGCAFTDDRGIRRYVSTKQTDRSEAMATCLNLERAASRAKQGLLGEAQARKILAEIVERTTGEKLSGYTIREWFGQWLSAKVGVIAESSHERYKSTANQFLDSLGEKADRPLASLVPGDVLAFREKLLKEGRAPRTVNMAVQKVVSAALKRAVKMGYIPTDPAAGIDSLRVERSEKKAFSVEDVKRLLSAASPEWKGVILCGYSTGLRLGDICNLRWQDVDLSDNLIRCRPGKTEYSSKAAVEVPLHPDLHQWFLLQTVPDDPGAPVFPGLHKKHVGGRSGLSLQFAQIMSRANLTSAVMQPRRGAEGRTVREHSFHSLRHTFISQMANAGIPVEIRQKLAGHSSADMNQRYTHPELQSLRSAVSSIASLST